MKVNFNYECSKKENSKNMKQEGNYGKGKKVKDEEIEIKYERSQDKFNYQKKKGKKNIRDKNSLKYTY